MPGAYINIPAQRDDSETRHTDATRKVEHGRRVLVKRARIAQGGADLRHQLLRAGYILVVGGLLVKVFGVCLRDGVAAVSVAVAMVVSVSGRHRSEGRCDFGAVKQLVQSWLVICSALLAVLYTMRTTVEVVYLWKKCRVSSR
jgi:hypothetical protein